MMEIITRAEAMAHKPPLKRYFTGKRCKHGHVAERYVSNGDCLQCHDRWAAAQNEKRGCASLGRKFNQDPLKNRSKAIALGKRRYFTGLFCIRGHLAERHIDGSCLECKRLDAQQRRVDDPERIRGIGRRHWERYRDKYRAQNKAWKNAHPDAQRVRRAKELYPNRPELADLHMKISKARGLLRKRTKREK